LDNLLKVHRKLEKNGFIVSTEVLRGDPPSLIVETAQRIQADLIVLGPMRGAVWKHFGLRV
jgi:nucleotide-binding universal stress UspA family protein